MRAHETEQAARVHEVMTVVSAIELERLGMSKRSAGYAMTGAALDLVRTIWGAPHRYCRWVDLDDLAGRAGADDLLAARKAVRLLADKGLLDIKGATMGPARTQVRIRNVPPYPVE